MHALLGALSGIAPYVKLLRRRGASRTGAISYQPILRNIGLPLGLFSSHHPAVCLAWPVANCFRLAHRSSCSDFYLQARLMFFARLRRAFRPEWLIEYYKDWAELDMRFFPEPALRTITVEYVLSTCGSLSSIIHCCRRRVWQVSFTSTSAALARKDC